MDNKQVLDVDQLVAVFKDYLQKIDEFNDGNDEREESEFDWCRRNLTSEELIPIEANANERCGYKVLTHTTDPCGLVDRLFLCIPNGNNMVEIHYAFGDSLEELFMYPETYYICQHRGIFDDIDIKVACRERNIGLILYNIIKYYINTTKK